MYAQSPCTANTPSFEVDLSGAPDSIWVSDPAVQRDGLCCSSSKPDECIEFELTLDSNVIAINFEIIDGAIPKGAMYYQIDCGPPTQVGDPICIGGPGPVWLTFCKPGNNKNVYQISSFTEPDNEPDLSVSIGCQIDMNVSGLDTPTIVWRDITSGNQQYNAYLECTTGCASNTVTPDANAPAFVDYEVCGDLLLKNCLPYDSFCDTIRVEFNSTLLSQITPGNLRFCSSTIPQDLTVNYTGGADITEYLWYQDGVNLNQDTATIQITEPGTYISEIRDENYPICPASFDTIYVVMDSFNTASYIGNAICEGDSINLSKIGGNDSFIWLGTGEFIVSESDPNPVYVPSLADLTSGSATISIVQFNTGVCPNDTFTQTIQIQSPFDLEITGDTFLCYNEQSILTAEINGGVAPFQYNWSNGQGNQSITIGAGVYSLEVSDLGNPSCSAFDTITVSMNPPIFGHFVVSDLQSCDTEVDYSIVTAGGEGPLQYSWSTGDSDSAIIASYGTFTVTITDANGCSIIIDTTTAPTNQIFEVSISGDSNICDGETSTLTVSTTNTNLTYSYEWSNSETNSIVSVEEGTYCVSVTDNNGCTLSECFTVNSSGVDYSISEDTILCFGDSGIVAVEYNDANIPNVVWSNGSTDLEQVLPGGVYSVIIQNDDNCAFYDTVVLDEVDPLTASSQLTAPTCYGYNDGIINLEPDGGRPPYIVYDSVQNEVIFPLDSLYAGSYTFEIQDQLACTQTVNLSIRNPDSLYIRSVRIMDNNCFGSDEGSVRINNNGGGSPYTYWLDNNSSLSNSFDDLINGTYNVKIVDRNGCVDSTAITITSPDSLYFNYTIDSVLCYGDASGRIIGVGQGGVLPYQFNWIDLGINDDTISSLSTGTYIVEAQDSNLCLVRDTISIHTYDKLDLDSNEITNVPCFSESTGEVSVVMKGGLSPYVYAWSNGGSGNSIVQLAAGNYTLTVTDNNLCDTVISYNITEPASIVSVNTSGDQAITCDSNVNVWAAGLGGIAPYTFEWNTGDFGDTLRTTTTGSYFVVITDSNSCTDTSSLTITATNSDLAVSISGQPVVCFDSLIHLTANITGGIPNYKAVWDNGDSLLNYSDSAGSHCVTITDDDGCLSSACHNSEMAERINMSPTDQLICIDDSVLIINDISGGNAPYSVNWDDYLEEDSIYMLAGVYPFRVTDQLSCYLEDTLTITEEDQMSIVFDHVFPVKCKSGSSGGFDFTVTGGVGPFQYSYQNTELTAPEMYFLSAGTYVIDVLDSLQCTFTDSITITEPAIELSASLDSIIDPTCFNYLNGYLNVMGDGGYPPYHYYWMSIGDTNSYLSGIGGGNYIISIIDSFGCDQLDTNTLINPLDFDIQTSLNGMKCYNVEDGEIVLDLEGATPPFEYRWSNNGIDSFINQLGEGSYFVTITDANACDTSLSFEIERAEPIAFNVAYPDSVCSNDPVLFSYSFSNDNARNGVVNWLSYGLTQDTLTVSYTSSFEEYTEIVDDSNCLYLDTVQVIVRTSDLGELTLQYDQLVCEGDSVVISVNHTGNEGPYSYAWESEFTGIGEQITMVETAYNNQLTITDVCDNQISEVVNIAISPAPSVDGWLSREIHCVPYEFNSGNVSFDLNDDVSWYVNGQLLSKVTDFSYNFGTAGEYTIELGLVSDEGCENNERIVNQISVGAIPEAYFESSVDSVYLNESLIAFTNLSDLNELNNWRVDDKRFTSEHLDYAFADTGLYEVSLIVSSLYNCVDTFSKTVKVKPLNWIKIPSAFTPSKDGPNGGTYLFGEMNNDVFHPHTEQVVDYRLNVFNRWGELIFESFDLGIGWDGYYRGELSDQGSYVWKIYVRFENGEEYNGVGDVLLLQ